MHAEKPREVRAAQLKQDYRALSEMDKKGAARRLQMEDLRAALRRELVAEQVAESAKYYSISPEGDILPPDSSL